MRNHRAYRRGASPEPRRSSLGKKIIGIAICLIGLGLIGIYSAFLLEESDLDYYEPPPAESAQAEPEEEEEAPHTYYPVGILIDGSPDRGMYVDGDLQLYIPRLELNAAVYNGTDKDTLAKGVGLFEQATLPADLSINSNTSIAGHRDVHHKEFYYIDTMIDGDRIYLTYKGDLYTYEVENSFITHDEDWSPIQTTLYPMVTLQSCDPIGTSKNRIFVVGRLVKVTRDSAFPAEGEEDAGGGGDPVTVRVDETPQAF